MSTPKMAAPSVKSELDREFLSRSSYGEYTLTLRALRVDQISDGKFAITIEGKQIEAKDYGVLERLFPHCQTEIDRLVQTELLLSALA